MPGVQTAQALDMAPCSSDAQVLDFLQSMPGVIGVTPDKPHFPPSHQQILDSMTGPPLSMGESDDAMLDFLRSVPGVESAEGVAQGDVMDFLQSLPGVEGVETADATPTQDVDVIDLLTSLPGVSEVEPVEAEPDASFMLTFTSVGPPGSRLTRGASQSSGILPLNSNSAAEVLAFLTTEMEVEEISAQPIAEDDADEWDEESLP